jgi:predicted permease
MTNLITAFRALRRTPVLNLAAVLSLAVGIGANAAIFSIFNQTLLRQLPVEQPEELVTFSIPGDKQGRTSSSNAGGSDAVVSHPLFRDLERGQRAFTGIAAHREIPANIAHRSRTSNEIALLVSGSYFPVLGLQPAMGRLFTHDDDRTPGAHSVVILSHAYWRSRFGEDPSILNDTIAVNGVPMTVVGVAPRGFEGTTAEELPRVYLPLTMSEAIHADYDLENRREHWLYLFGRLKPGLSREAAQSSINGLFSGLLQNAELPAMTGGLRSDRQRSDFLARKILLAEGARGEQPNRGEMVPVFILLFSMTGIVILIACANIANLLLARGVARAGEFAVRLSLGASRGQLATQLMLESCLLAIAGGAVGLFVARWMLDVVRTTLPSAAGSHLQFEADLPLLAFGFALSLLTALLFGMLPAIHSTRIRVTTMAKSQGGVTSTGASSPLRSALVTSQIALALALLVVAGLFAKSLVNISRIDLGMQISNVTTFRVSPALNGYSDARAHLLFEQVADELAAVPGVTSVAESSLALLDGSDASANVTVRGFEAPPDAELDASTTLIGPQFFSTLGIPLITGREFTRADTSTSQPVAIVNEAFAKKFNLARDAVVGTRMELGRNDTPKFDIEIVGLVQNAKYSGAKDETPPIFYLPHRQRESVRELNYYVRSSLDASGMNAAVSSIMRKLDPNLPIEELQTMDAHLRERSAGDVLLARIAMSFAALATLLAAIGLYGVLAYSVAQRTPEIGVRLALGADAGRIRQMILGHVGRLAVAGVVLGLVGALVLGRYAASMLFRVQGVDAPVMFAAVAIVVFVSLGAAMVPAYRASRIDPARALRWE